MHMDGHLVLVEKPESVLRREGRTGQARAHSASRPTGCRRARSTHRAEITARIEGALKYTGTGHVDDPQAVNQALLRRVSSRPAEDSCKPK
jgi:hypothetical protein